MMVLRAGRHSGLFVAAAGLAVLVLGCLVYLVDRGSSHVPLLHSIHLVGGHGVFGVLGQWLPSFAHTCAFGLFTAAAMPAVSSLRQAACATWCVINVAFELGQHPLVSKGLAGAVHTALGPGPVSQLLQNYFVRGTFDVGDIVAAVLGALTAACVVRTIEEKHRAQ